MKRKFLAVFFVLTLVASAVVIFTPDNTAFACTDYDYDGFDDYGTDSDGDGLDDCQDFCPFEWGDDGVGCPQQGPVDSDGDGFTDDVDFCPNEGDLGTGFDANGCALPPGAPQPPNGPPGDADGDGVPDANDQCPNQGLEVLGGVDGIGCPAAPPDPAGAPPPPPPPAANDADGDGVPDGIDQCNTHPPGLQVDANGCPPGVPPDGAPGGVDPNAAPPPVGAPAPPALPDPTTTDDDGDGVMNAVDQCLNEGPVIPQWVDANGCLIQGANANAVDTDGDGVNDNNDACPNDVGFTVNGCPGDFDNDGVADDFDPCPFDPGSGGWGCPGNANQDTDGDGLPDNQDTCPFIWGLNADGCAGDADGDGWTDNIDPCPNAADPNGCPGDGDTDGDGWPDGIDVCPNDPSPATGCSNDADGDGWPDNIDPCPNQFDVNVGCPGGGGDIDGDGVIDSLDNCPFDGNLGQGIQPNGCPVGAADQDGDFILDQFDACPTRFGWTDSNFAYGCPDDTDGDFILDDVDACPTQHDNFTSQNGCLVAGGTAVRQPTAKPSAAQTPTNRPTTKRNTTNSTSNSNTPTVKRSGNPNTTTATACPATGGGYQPARLEVNGLGRSTSATTTGNAAANQRLNFRQDAGLRGRIIGTINPLDDFIVLQGPLCSTEGAQELRWWYVYFDGQGGWLAESDGENYFVEPVPLPANAQVTVLDLAADPRGDRQSIVAELGQLPAGSIISLGVSTQGSPYVDIANAQQQIINFGNEIGNFNVTAAGAYSVYGESEQEGKFVIVVVQPATNTAAGGQATTPGRVPGRPGAAAANAAPAGRPGT